MSDRDNAPEMAESATSPYFEDHPILVDTELRERVLDVMWFQLQKTISRGQPPRRRGASTAGLQLAGSIRADAVLNDALDRVLRFDPDRLENSWEALATRIAQRAAAQAVRDNVRGRQFASGEVDLMSIDADTDYGDRRSVVDLLQDELADPEAEAAALVQQRAILRLVDELLSQRDRDIFLRRHYLDQTLASIAERHGLTEPGARHVYRSAAKRVLRAARQDPDFQRMSDPDEGGDT